MRGRCVVRRVSRCDLYVVYLQLDNKHDSQTRPAQLFRICKSKDTATLTPVRMSVVPLSLE